MTVIKVVLTFYLDIFEAWDKSFMNVSIHIVDVILQALKHDVVFVFFYFGFIQIFNLIILKFYFLIGFNIDKKYMAYFHTQSLIRVFIGDME